MRSAVVRMMLGLVLVSSSSFAEDDDKNILDEAQEGIKKTTDEVGAKAGVKGEVMHGAKYGSAGRRDLHRHQSLDARGGSRARTRRNDR